MRSYRKQIFNKRNPSHSKKRRCSCSSPDGDDALLQSGRRSYQNWMLVAYPVIMNLPKKLVNAFFNDIRKNPVIPCRPETYKVIQRHFDSMKDLDKDKGNSNRIEIISSMLAALLYILGAESSHAGLPQKNHKSKKHQALSERFFVLIFRDFRRTEQ